MAWVRFTATTRLVVAGHQTEALSRAAIVTGQSVIEVDDSAGGNALPADFAPGFQYVTALGVVVSDPISGATAKREATLAALRQLDTWEDNLFVQGRGQPSAIRELVHDLILGQRKALYLRSTAAAAAGAAIQSYAGQISMGSSDITTVQTFFQKAAGINKGTWADGDPVEWATLTGSVATRRLLQAAITAAPTDFRASVRDFSAINLGTDDWVLTAITA